MDGNRVGWAPAFFVLLTNCKIIAKVIKSLSVICYVKV